MARRHEAASKPPKGQHTDASRRKAEHPRGCSSPDERPSQISADVLAFADRLRGNAAAARKFQEDEVRSRLGTPATKNAQTMFINRAVGLAVELHERIREFADLRARCDSRDPCRWILDEFGKAGLSEHLRDLAEDLERIVARARQPLTAAERAQVDADSRDVLLGVNALVEIADQIASEVEAAAARGQPDIERRSELPPDMREMLRTSARSARQFVEMVANRPPDLGRGNNESTLAWIQFLSDEHQRIATETQSLASALSRISNEDLAAVERAGHEALAAALARREEVFTRVKAKRNVAISLIKLVIDKVHRLLSLTDQGEEAEARISYTLRQIWTRLDEEQAMLDAVASRASHDRLASAARIEDLPEWEEIYKEGVHTGTRMDGIGLLVMAFLDPDSDEQEFSDATKELLTKRLEKRFGVPSVGSWLDRRVAVAVDLGIVVKLPRVEGSSKRLPDWFRVSEAAIRKYRGSFPAR